MPRRLAVNVVLRHPDSHQVVRLAAGDVPPDWALLGDHVWADDDAEELPAPAPSSSALARPPKHGTGSGRDAWAKYARSLGIDVDDDASRTDIIAAVEAAD